MKIRNDLVRIQVGKKKYDFHNLILNEYLRRFALAQTDKDKVDAIIESLIADRLKGLNRLLIKFEEALEITEESELTYRNFDISIENDAEYIQTFTDKQITIQYDYKTRNQTIMDIADGLSFSFGLDKFYGKKITALGFASDRYNNYDTSILAVLDTSNYNIYLEENQGFTVTRRDIITTDAEFWSNDKTKVPGPVHLAPYGVPQIIYQPNIYNNNKSSWNSFYNNAYGALYSIGKGYVPNIMYDEKIIGKDATIENNGTSLTISSIENKDAETEVLYPSEDLFPSEELFPSRANYNYIILKYKVWQLVHSGEYDNYEATMTDTGYYYHQAIPINKYGELKTIIKYERG